MSNPRTLLETEAARSAADRRSLPSSGSVLRRNLRGVASASVDEMPEVTIKVNIAKAARQLGEGGIPKEIERLFG